MRWKGGREGGTSVLAAGDGEEAAASPASPTAAVVLGEGKGGRGLEAWEGWGKEEEEASAALSHSTNPSPLPPTCERGRRRRVALSRADE